MEEIGKVTHWFGHINVAVVELQKELKIGDTIHVKGAHTDFSQPVESMQIEHEQVEKAVAGQSVGLKVKEHVHEGNVVFKE